MGMRPIIVALMYGSIGLLFVGIGIPLALGKVRPNPWYGFRTAKTLSSTSIWYAANHVAGIDLIIAGAAIVLGVAAIYLLRETLIPTLPLATCAFSLFVVAMVTIVIHGFWFLSRI